MDETDSYNISVSFKTNLAQLNLLEQTCRNAHMSRSQIIRDGIALMISKLSKIHGNTNNTENMGHSVDDDSDDWLPSADMFGMNE